MIHKKKLKYLENNYTIETPKAIHPFDRQNKYIDLVRSNLFKTRVAEPVDAINNAEGLKRAYLQPNSLYIHGNVLHIAGTQAGRAFTTYRNGQPWSDATQDWWDDLKIPFHLTNQAVRYKDAKEVLKNNPNITHLNGHSLGSAVALQLQKDMPERNFTVSAYGTPTVSFTQSDNRYRNPGDYISILDRGTKTTGEEQPSLNPLKAHGYDNFNHTSETNSGGWVIDKQFKPQPQYNAPMAPMAVQPQDDNTGWIMSAQTNNYSAPIK